MTDIDIPDTILEEIAEQVKKGFTKGRVDSEDIHSAWEIEITTWKDD